MPKASATVTQLFNQIWQLPDKARWMDPLPSFHRRAIIIAVAIILLAFLWPAPSPEQPQRPVTAGGQPESRPMQAELSDQRPDAEQPSAPVASPDTQGEWRAYQIASGQTLAQLFRDNNLPVNDVFAMAQVEGEDKPLSTLHTGQAIRIRQSAQGTITGLTVVTDQGQVLFTRQPDGSFLRVR
ncbi:LysM-like peptidoglycan-binding domain-containing protein [Pantoea sp. FN060301]|uniref:LysM-like peptidoglycan-binding domain-containing protein n=1 Tax=Pantoea sp. FN060301 TaxID=3420380 RepID=UPI003D176E1A